MPSYFAPSIQSIAAFCLTSSIAVLAQVALVFFLAVAGWIVLGFSCYQIFRICQGVRGVLCVSGGMCTAVTKGGHTALHHSCPD